MADNESKMISCLVRSINEQYSINQLAKQVGLTPKGAHKLLKRLEQAEIINPKKIGNGIFYSINFKSDFARKIAELSLFEKIKSAYIKVQAKDIEAVKNITEAVILFGSILEKGDKANDIDILVIIEKQNYGAFSKAMDKLQKMKPKRFHAVIQSKEDLIKNIRKNDAVILEALKKGKVLWGQSAIIESIAEAEL